MPKSSTTVKIYEQQNAIEKSWHLERYFVTKEYAQKLRSFFVGPGDIIVSCAGTIGELYVLPPGAQEGLINQALMRIRVKSSLDKNWFIYAFMRMIDKFSAKFSNGSAIKNIPPFADLKNYELFLPNILEQKRIARMLLAIDHRISVQNKIIEALVEQMNAIRCRIFSNVKGETAPLSEVISYEQPTPYIVKSDEYSYDASLTPVLTANKAFILGYTNEAEGIYRKGDAIIFDDFTLDLKYVDFPFKVKSSAIKILSCRDKRVVRYAFEYLSFLGLSSSEHKRHYISEVAGKKIIVPEIHVVETISSLFNSLEKRIRNETKIKELMERQKKFFLNAMFI